MDGFHSSYEYELNADDRNNTAAAVYRMARAGGKRVLDLGSGPGIVSSRLTLEDGRSVTCVDGDAERLAVARKRGVERTILADLDRGGWVDELGSERFDVIILADVLEHLIAPEAVLDVIHGRLLTEDGFIVVSIPNASHEGIIAELMTGRFTYREAGLLDSTHLRFFTKDSFTRLAEAHGFRVTELHRTVLPLEDTEMRTRAGDLPLSVRMAILGVNPECRTYQFIARLEPLGRDDVPVRSPPEPAAHQRATGSSLPLRAEEAEDHQIRPASTTTGIVSYDDDGHLSMSETIVDHLAELARGADRVLAIGAGAAAAVAHLVARNHAHAVYVDIDPRRVDAARERGIERTIVAPITDGRWIDMLAGESFDAIILGDLLERSIRPGALLDMIRDRALLAPGGAIAAAVRNMSSLGALAGLFETTDAAHTDGLTDANRVRFFTRQSLIEMCGHHGFVVREIRRIVDTSDSWLALPSSVREYLADTVDARTSHFVFCAEPAAEPHEFARLLDRIERLENEHRVLLEEITAERRGFLALHDQHDAAVGAQEALRGKANRFREAAEAQRRLAEERRLRLAAIYRRPSWRVARLLALAGRSLRDPIWAVRRLRARSHGAVGVSPQPEPLQKLSSSASEPTAGAPEPQTAREEESSVREPSIGTSATGVVSERTSGTTLAPPGEAGALRIPRVSIVIPVYNGLAVTRQCLESIFAGTIGARFEVVVVDNASSDGASAWLGAQRERWPDMTLISNETNRGFGPGVNQGAEAARGEYILICNSDVIIPGGSIDRLVQALDENPDVGVVSPVTNYVGEGPQRDNEASDATPETVAEYAAHAADRSAPLAYVPDRLVFFCVLARKGLFDLLGGFPEAYGIGNFEDDDFCVRARITGHKLAIDPNAFVFHHGSATWQGTEISHNEWMQRNRPIYFQRLGELSTTLVPRPRATVRQPEITVVVRTVDRPHLLREALVSLANQTFAGFEVVVVNDGGPSVESLLADLEPYVTVRYVHHPEARGRAAALNSGLAAARGPWVTYLDDDDIVYPVHLDVLFHAVRETGFRVAYSDTNRALCRGEARRNEVVKREPYGSFEFHPTRLLVANRLPIQTIIHAAGCVAAVGQFDEGIDLLEDWDFVIRLSRRFPFHHVRRVTSEYRFRVSAGAGNAMIAQREDVLASQLALYERYPVSDERLRQERSDQIGHLRTQIERIREIRVSALSDAAKALSIACLVSGVPIDEDEGASGSARRKEAER